MDSVIKSDVHYQEHTGQLTHKTTQPTENIILNRNAELRKNKGAMKDLGAGENGGTWGRQVATIPFIKLQEAVNLGYDIYNKDAKVASAELFKYLESEQGKPCMIVEDNNRSSGGIIVK